MPKKYPSIIVHQNFEDWLDKGARKKMVLFCRIENRKSRMGLVKPGLKIFPPGSPSYYSRQTEVERRGGSLLVLPPALRRSVPVA